MRTLIILHIHTQDVGVREKLGQDSRNYCIDVGNSAVTAILCDGELNILDRQ